MAGGGEASVAGAEGPVNYGGADRRDLGDTEVLDGGEGCMIKIEIKDMHC